CFETHASGEGLAKRLAAALASRSKYIGPLADKPNPTAHDLFAAYETGDEIAREVLAEAIEFWGMAAANLVSLFNPQKIILGGGVFGPATQFIDTIYEEARRWAQPIAIQRVSFEPAQLGPDAGLYGAGFLALESQHQLYPDRREGSKATPDSSLRAE
ncbi:MAG TPA: ROK family protein, partial [Lacipirellula sp.]